MHANKTQRFGGSIRLHSVLLASVVGVVIVGEEMNFGFPALSVIQLVCVVSALLIVFASASKPSSKNRIVVGTVQTLTSPDGSPPKDYGGTRSLSGLRFWVDHTNEQGGVQLPDRDAMVELRYYNDMGDEMLAKKFYEKLVLEREVDFLFSGGAIDGRTLVSIANNSKTVVMASNPGTWYSVVHPLLFQMHKSLEVTFPLDDFSEFLTRMAAEFNIQRLVFYENSQNPAGKELCRHAHAIAQGSGWFSVAVINESAPLTWKDQIIRDGSQVLIACTTTTGEAGTLMHSLVENGLLYGWETNNHYKYNPTLIESPTPLLATCFIDGVNSADFLLEARGWADKMLGAVFWAPQLRYRDPYFGDALHVNEEWKNRGDFGDGEDMHSDAAAAVGAGVVLRLAIEAAGTTDTSAVVAALQDLNNVGPLSVRETLYGWVRFDADGRNVGHKAAMVQWQCNHSDVELTYFAQPPCEQHVVHPVEYATAAVQAYRQACDAGSIRSSLLDLHAAEDVFVFAEDGVSGVDVEALMPDDKRACKSCVAVSPADIQELMDLGPNNKLSLEEACKVFRAVVSVGALFSKSDDAATIAAVKLAVEVVMGSMEIMPNVPLELHHVTTDTVSEGNLTRINNALRAVVSDVSAASPRAGFVWSSGQAETVGEIAPRLLSTLQEASRPNESQTIFTWHETSVSLVPPPTAQAFGLVRLVEHFGWNRCRLIQGHEATFADMHRVFADKAEVVGLTMLETIVLPPEGDPAREGVLASMQEFNDCEGRILVLCTSARDAEAVFETMRTIEEEGVWTGEFVFVAAEEAARAPNIPPGLLSLRSVASDDSRSFTDLTLRLETMGLEQLNLGGIGIGVDSSAMTSDDLDDATEVSKGTLVEDRAYFAYDAVIAMCSAVWMMLTSEADLASPEALRLALQQVRFEGASGTVAFDDQMQRTHGRYALLNWDGEYWSSLAYWDLEGSGVIIHTAQPWLRQSRWEAEAVSWGRLDGSAGPGTKPLDVCSCVLFDKIPEAGFDFRTCVWAWQGIATAVGQVVLILLCIACTVRRCCRRTRKLDWEEELLLTEVDKLRARLHVTKKDGFILSSEPQTMRLPWLRELRVLQRSHLEAVARMSMLAEFDVRAVDAFASCFYAGEATFDTTEKRDLNVLKSYSKMDSPRGERPYVELRKLLLDVSRILLQPSPPHVSGRTKGSETTSSNDHDSNRTSSRGATRSARSWSIWPNSRSSDQRERAIPRTTEERFAYFLQYVSKVQMWVEDDHRLFHTLQHTVVQEQMDKLHSKCDDLFKKIKDEDAGSALVAFQWPPPSAASAHSGRATPPPSQGVGPVGDEHMHFAEADDELSLATEEVRAQLVISSGQRADAELHDVDTLFARAPPSLCCQESPSSSLLKLPPPSLEPSPALSPAVVPVPYGGRKPKFNYASITRQDHPAVRAIRLDEEDQMEVALQRSNPAVGIAEMHSNSAVEVLDEDLYITALRRRALLLNEEFQQTVRSAVEARFGSTPLDVTVEREDGGGRRRSLTQQQHAEVQQAVHVVERVHSAPVKTKARMREKLVAYACSAPGERETCTHPLTANILDPIRCTVVCRGAKEILEHVTWLMEHGEELGLPVVRVKNKFAMENSDEYDGYRDMMLCVLFTGSSGLRIVCEVQIHDLRLHELKLQMHKLYKVKRATAAACI